MEEGQWFVGGRCFAFRASVALVPGALGSDEPSGCGNAVVQDGFDRLVEC